MHETFKNYPGDQWVLYQTPAGKVYWWNRQTEEWIYRPGGDDLPGKGMEAVPRPRHGQDRLLQYVERGVFFFSGRVARTREHGQCGSSLTQAAFFVLRDGMPSARDIRWSGVVGRVPLRRR